MSYNVQLGTWTEMKSQSQRLAARCIHADIAKTFAAARRLPCNSAFVYVTAGWKGRRAARRHTGKAMLRKLPHLVQVVRLLEDTQVSGYSTNRSRASSNTTLACRKQC